MTSYMLDTNVCIYVINERPADVLPIFNAHASMMCISEITRYELLYGAYKSQSTHKVLANLQRFFAMLKVMPFDAAAAEHAAQIRAQLAQAGTPIGPLDNQIAGHARSMAAILVTNNTKEFERVGGLMLENWVDSPESRRPG